MENLEKVASSTSLEISSKTETKSEGYEGLATVEDRPYTGGTSVKYWM